MFEIRKNLDLRKILVTPKIFLKSRFYCIEKNEKKYQISDKKLGRNPRSDRDLCEKGNKSPKKK